MSTIPNSFNCFDLVQKPEENPDPWIKPDSVILDFLGYDPCCSLFRIRFSKLIHYNYNPSDWFKYILVWSYTGREGIIAENKILDKE